MISSFKALETEAKLDLDVRFDPDRRFYCLFGSNGVGKTHLIEHLARTFLYSHTMFDFGEPGRRGTGIIQDTIVGPALSPLKMRLALQIEVDGELAKSRDLEKWGNCVLGNGLRSRYEWRVDRPIVFVGARKRGYTPNIESSQLRLLGNAQDRFVRAFRTTWRAATGEQVEIEEPAEWFASRILINPAFVEDNEPDIEAVLEVLRLLQRLDPKEFEGIVLGEPPKERPGLTYTNGALIFSGRPIDKLATGYVAVLKIFQEIVAGYSGWSAMMDQGKTPSSLRETDGVVFIDELEAHLHPQWQTRIVNILKDSFPNTTFFVTTHSPLVVRQTEPGEAIELYREGNRVLSRQLGSPRDWYLADVYSEAFHVDIPLPGQDAPEGESPIHEVMLEFSNSVREYAAGKDGGVRSTALTFHDQIDKRLPPDDPRRRSLVALRELLG